MGYVGYAYRDLCTCVIILETSFFIEIKLLCQNSIDTLKFPYKNAIQSSTPTSSVESAFLLMSLAALDIIFVC